MQGRILRRRTRARRSAGYTLIELMVVVVLIALLAMIAAPSMVRARSDRLAFSFARDASSVIHHARTRAAGRGAAHLVLYLQSTNTGNRGTVMVFEALDGTAPSAVPPGPNPAPSCRRPGQWAFAAAWTPGIATDAAHLAAVVDGMSVNSSGTGADVIDQENIRMKARFSVMGSADPPADIAEAFAMCITPSGTTYFGQGSNADAAITTMQRATTPFADIVELDVARHDPGPNPPVVGLNRRVIVAGSSAPRIKSE